MDTNMVLNTSFNDLVFENRHKDYGAYQIRKRYSRNVLLAAFFAITFFTMTIGAYFINMPESNAAMITDPPRRVDTNIVVLKTNDPPKNKPKAEPKPAAPKGSVNTITTNIVIKDSVPAIANITDTVGSPTGKVKGPGTLLDTGTVAVSPCTDCDSVKPPRRVTWLPVMPKDPGLDAFFKKNIKYPQLAKDQNIEGVVYLTFIVDTKGDVREIAIAKGAHPLLDREVLRVAKFMPKWEPVKDESGELVEYQYSKPVRFTLAK